jgi:hypothetical protein
MDGPRAVEDAHDVVAVIPLDRAGVTSALVADLRVITAIHGEDSDIDADDDVGAPPAPRVVGPERGLS